MCECKKVVRMVFSTDTGYRGVLGRPYDTSKDEAENCDALVHYVIECMKDKVPVMALLSRKEDVCVKDKEVILRPGILNLHMLGFIRVEDVRVMEEEEESLGKTQEAKCL